MDNHRLRAIIIKLQDYLSDNDRRRLHFFLGNDVPRRIRDDPSLGGTLCLMESLFDQDKISEQDFTFLINAFDEIQCTDAVKLLKEHMRRIRSNEVGQSVQSLISILPHNTDLILADEEEDKIAMPTGVLIEENIGSTNYNVTFPEKHTEQIDTNVNSTSSSSSYNTYYFHFLSKVNLCLILSIFSIIFLIGALIGVSLQVVTLKSNLKMKETSFFQAEQRYNETIQYLEGLRAMDNLTIITMSKQIAKLDEEQQWREGTTCGCAQWCKEHGSPYGVCGDGHTCICRNSPVTRVSIDEGCSCDSWCRKRGYRSGGICGDGYTCICS